MAIKSYKKIFALLMCLIPTIAYADYIISPAQLTIKLDEVGILTLKNTNFQHRYFKLAVHKKTNEYSEEIFEETKDLIVIPTAFKVEPGKTQVIEVKLKDSINNNNSNSYTLTIHDLSNQNEQENPLTKFIIPISIEDI